MPRDSISFRTSRSRSIVGIIVPFWLVSTNVLLLLLLRLPTRLVQPFDTVRVVVVLDTATTTINIGTYFYKYTIVFFKIGFLLSTGN